MRTALVLVTLAAFIAAPASAVEEDCVTCHRQETPSIVLDWEGSAHSAGGVSCVDCHGGEHKGMNDVGKVLTPTAATCGDCHSENFARAELAKGDDTLREADRLLAEAIRVITGLYQDGILEKPEAYAYPFPDLLTFHDAPTSVEQTLFEMHLKRRMRAFQGAFHANPDYALWYGWSEMVRDLTEIKEKAAELRRGHGG